VGARSKARKRALDVLYEAEQRRTDPLVTLQDRLAQNDPPVPPYAEELVKGVVAHRARIDELLTTYAQDWTIDRFPAVDLQVLRIGAYELLYCPDVPDEVAVSEAVELAASLSTDESPAFVNGLLGRLLQLKPALGS
jgi:N utilization substance protein B